MNHPLFVGHFEGAGRHHGLKVVKPLAEAEVLPTLYELCDLQDDGSSSVETGWSESRERWPAFVGRINGEDVSFHKGYLICPWLGTGTNHKSLLLVHRLHDELGLQVYEQGDGAYLTSEEILLMREDPSGGK